MANLKISQLTNVSVPAGSTEWHVNEAGLDKALSMTQQATFTLDGSHDSNFNWNGSLLAITGNLTATNVNGIALTTGGAATDYLDGSGNYSVPATNAHASTHTNGTDDIQSAGAAQKGLVDTAAQTFAGLKTFTTPARMSTLNTGDNVITTDTDGDLQESGVSVESTSNGGSLINMVAFTTAPTAPTDNDAWIRNEGGQVFFEWYKTGVTYSVEMGALP